MSRSSQGRSPGSRISSARTQCHHQQRDDLPSSGDLRNSDGDTSDKNVYEFTVVESCPRTTNKVVAVTLLLFWHEVNRVRQDQEATKYLFSEDYDENQLGEDSCLLKPPLNSKVQFGNFVKNIPDSLITEDLILGCKH